MSLRTRSMSGPAAPGRGFTAIEITAVVTIIAILALILIPIVRNRVEDARITAAQDDLNSIDKAETMAFGYTGHYFRLHDLMRREPTEAEKSDINSVWQYVVPPAAANFVTYDVFTPSQLNGLKNNWKGPYLSVQRFEPLSDLVSGFPDAFSGSAGAYSGNGGPILIYDEDDYKFNGDTGGLYLQKYPIDPWGNPYFFFSPNAAETDYSTAMVYSMGPDMLPGAATAPAPEDYWREPVVNARSGSDDLIREF